MFKELSAQYDSQDASLKKQLPYTRKQGFFVDSDIGAHFLVNQSEQLNLRTMSWSEPEDMVLLEGGKDEIVFNMK